MESACALATVVVFGSIAAVWIVDVAGFAKTGRGAIVSDFGYP
jgi:cytochrome bd-type quinol oxidase subunit 1